MRVGYSQGRQDHLGKGAEMRMAHYKAPPTGYWTFFCNPRVCAPDVFLQEHVRSKPPTGGWLYRVTQYQAKRDWFAPEQMGVLRVGRDTRTRVQRAGRPRLEPGIYAIMKVIGEPRWTGDNSVDGYPNPADADVPDWRVAFRYLHVMLHDPIPMSDLPPIVSDPYLLDGSRMRGKSSMPLEPAAFQWILSWVERRDRP